ncbi:MAG: hypothetical protein HY909_03020 [Deltaproteobacteria bacterium]|nr:hypothetical protein [Deltaproteobacteria bacterium]
MRFEPIAIVGRHCTLPGADNPDALTENVLAGRSALGPAPAGRWGLARELALGGALEAGERAWSDIGGYVTGFDARFDPEGFALPAEELAALDPVVRWVLHTGREALRACGHEGASPRAGLVLGNLSFPSAGLSRYAEGVWLGERALRDGGDARNRFMSGLTAHLAARALGLGAGGFALDAACASSLYAIKLACDRLQDRRADLMLAGAVNCADDLFIHVGFCALSALSRTGQSRPFHRDADGLVPAEGCALVALKRLGDAVSAGDTIHGVLRGVGLSNDGRGRGMLAPSEEGQERAMRLAYRSSGLSPRDVTLVECHATGTPVGDGTEVRSMARVFEGLEDVPIGSLKGNLGHLITAAGVSGLLKVLGAMRAGLRPPTLHADRPIEALEGSPFRLVTAPEPWEGRRLAAVSAFGFGGNNAHLLVEAWDGQRSETSAGARVTSSQPIAVVSLGARVSRGDSRGDFARALFSGDPSAEPRVTVDVQLEGLRAPPRDLTQTLAQQLLVLESAREAVEGLGPLPRERTSVLVGMGADPEVARYGARWRLAQWARAWEARDGGALPGAWVEAARDAVVPRLDASGVVGTMPNIVANRVSAQLDAAGPGFVVSAEEASGMVALDLAARALRADECDLAVVCAVDLSHEPVHQHALAALGRSAPPGDGAVALVLQRLGDARRDGRAVLAVLSDHPEPEGLSLGDAPGALDLRARFGAPHAAVGLLQVAAGVLALYHRARPSLSAPATPWLAPRAARVTVTPLGGEACTAHLVAGDHRAFGPEGPPRWSVYAGSDRAAVLASLARNEPSGEGPARLVLTWTSEPERALRSEAAMRWLTAGGPPPEGVAFRSTPLGGEVACVFTGAAAAYTHHGRDLALAFPAAVDALGERLGDLSRATGWVYGPPDAEPSHPLDQLWGCAFLCQLHAELTLRVLKLPATAGIGYSSGESNSLFAFGAWRDPGAMIAASWQGELFTRDLVGECRAAAEHWRTQGHPTTGAWQTYSIVAPVDAVRRALEGEPRAHLTIVNTPDDCVIAGERAACERVIAALGPVRALPLGYDMACHCPEVSVVRDAWWRLHHRETHEVPGVRFYTHGTHGSYLPTPEACADAITGQALHTVEFPRLIERAYADGVRVFVEHGPRGLCSGWIKRILGERDHLAIPLDLHGRPGLRQLAHAIAWLLAAGVPLDTDALSALLPPAEALPSGRRLTLPAHPPALHLPPLAFTVQHLEPAPWLPPVLGDLTPQPPLHEWRGGDSAVEAQAPSPVNNHAATALPSGAPSPFMERGLGGEVVLSALEAHVAQLSALHQAHLATASALHQQFLALQARMAQRLLAMVPARSAATDRSPRTATSPPPTPSP